MKKYFKNLIVCIFLFNVIILSQTISNNTDNSLKKHSVAIQFAIGSGFNIKSFDSVFISLKYHFSDRSALRFGAGIAGNSQRSVVTSYESNPSYSNSENIYFFGSYLFYPKPTAYFNFYFGLGPRFSFKHKYEDPYNKMYTWSAGLQFNIGVEWFAAKRLSLFAEYIAYFTVGKTTADETMCSGGICQSVYINTTDWQLNLSKTMLGLSVYF